MADDQTTDLDPGAAIVRGYVYRALEILARDLQGRLRDGDGPLAEADIEQALDRLRDSRSPVIGAICRAAWQECELLFESETRREDRKAAFERLLVWPFAHLLPESGARDGGAGTISRRIIPGYLAAIEDLVGPVVFGRHQERCRELVRGIRRRRGGAFNWDDVYADPLAQTIVDDLLVSLAKEFEDFAEQRDWFIGLVNDAMPLPTNGSGHSLSLDDEGFGAIMRALYRHIAGELQTGAGRDRLGARHSPPTIEAVESLLSELEEA